MRARVNALLLFWNQQVGSDGYVFDLEDARRVLRRLCKELNERFLVPQRSNVINSRVADGQVNERGGVLCRPQPSHVQ
jgi:hypothetical protein